MEMTDYDIHDMMTEMGICPNCHDHTPCGCEPVEDDDFDMTPIQNTLGDAVTRLNNLLGDYSI